MGELQSIKIRKCRLFIAFFFLPHCLDSLNYNQHGAICCVHSYVERICIEIKTYATRMYTVQMWLWRCGMHVSLNWLKSIGNRKRCRVLHSRSFWYSRDVSVLAPHVMASHEHTYIWSPTAASSETDKGLKLFDFLFPFSETQPRLQLSGFLFPSSQYCFDFLDLDVFLSWVSLRVISQSNSRSNSHVNGKGYAGHFVVVFGVFKRDHFQAKNVLYFQS